MVSELRWWTKNEKQQLIIWDEISICVYNCSVSTSNYATAAGKWSVWSEKMGLMYELRAIDNVFFDRSRYVHAYGNIYAVFFIFYFFLFWGICWPVYLLSSAVLLREDKMENVCVERISRFPSSIWQGRSPYVWKGIKIDVDSRRENEINLSGCLTNAFLNEATPTLTDRPRDQCCRRN